MSKASTPLLGRGVVKPEDAGAGQGGAEEGRGSGMAPMAFTQGQGERWRYQTCADEEEVGEVDQASHRWQEMAISEMAI